MPPRLDLFGLVVRDLERSLAFYRRLGLDIPEDADPEGHGHVEATVGGLRIAWDTVETIRSFDPEWTPPSGGGNRMALAFRFETPTEVNAAYQELTAAGYEGHKAPWDAFWGQRYAEVRDPDGNTIDLFAPS
jgi:catechol 2,3-dioxygenase-like lactoylglutathione lyase family enzyme